uniref:Uncharacterized protein n=1 Tax=Salix viminalis TaxID=40686 RepID=A0A6N2MBH5_SALVM
MAPLIFSSEYDNTRGNRLKAHKTSSSLHPILFITSILFLQVDSDTVTSTARARTNSLSPG